MPLEAGLRLGPYEIVAPIGAGGMGEVYRARDTRLDRTVAIKVLPAALAADPQLRERFDREARAISALNHPHICTLYDVGHQDPSTGSGQAVDYLVLEHLEGETLGERLGRSRDHPLRSQEALAIAIDIADALATAHRAGVIHRDLKPANVFLVRSGGAAAPPSAKLLDFGLAKAAAPVISGVGPGFSRVGTAEAVPYTPLTAQGTILGTFQYMAPEQIEGLEADARTDIFAFGAVLFEMLTGRTAFEGKTRAQLLGAILKDEPPPVPHVSPALNRVISTCLAKDPDDRWQTARDLLRELRWAAEAEHARSGPAEAGPYVRRSSGVAWAIAAVAIVGMLATSAIAFRHLRETPLTTETYQFTIAAPENSQFGSPPGGGTGVATQVAVSPDGRQITFVAKTQGVYALWLRPIGSLAPRLLPGTEGAAFPFWSPDSRFIGFFAGGKLKKVQASGGPPIVLCDAASGRGGTWNHENVIVFAPNTTGPLQRVSGAGGVPMTVSSLDTAYGETSHRWPHFLPDGLHFLFTGTIGTCCPASKPARVRVGSLDWKDAPTLLQVESASAFSSGHLFFVSEGTLMAQQFDPSARRLRGDAFPVAETVAGEGSRYASFSVSDSGTLVYARGALGTAARLVWFDRTGKALGTLGEAGTYGPLALSPDERRVAVGMQTGSPANRDVWTVDVTRGVSSRLTFDPTDEGFPIWSPDGARIVFSSLRQGEMGLRIMAASGALKDQPLLTVDGLTRVPVPDDWSADGRFIIYETNIQGGIGSGGQIGIGLPGGDLWILPVPDAASARNASAGIGDGRKPFPFVQAPGQQNRAVFAPDGHWIAYCSDESGVYQVYVQPFPPTGGRYQISRNGGAQPQWRGDGKELFFLAPDATVMSASIDTAHEFQASLPQPLFTAIGTVTSGRRQYAVSRDGKRFLMVNPDRATTTSPLTVVVNWLASVQK